MSMAIAYLAEREKEERRNMVKVITAYRDGTGILKCDLIKRVGEIFLKSGGERYMAEVFLKSLISASWDDPESLLAPALADYKFGQRKYQAGKIYEDCCAYLLIRLDELQPETVIMLERIAGHPPYPQFMDNVRGKMVEFETKAYGRAAV